MHSDLDLNERFDYEVQRFAKQFGFDIMIVQDAYEQCLHPNRFTEEEYHDLKSDRKKLGTLIRHLEKAKETSECISSILKATYKIEGCDIADVIGSLLNLSEDTQAGIERIYQAHTRKHGRNPNAQFLADWLALIFVKSGLKPSMGTMPTNNNPSTRYCRLLVKVFEHYEISGRSSSTGIPHWRRYGERAIAQLNVN